MLEDSSAVVDRKRRVAYTPTRRLKNRPHATFGLEILQRLIVVEVPYLFLESIGIVPNGYIDEDFVRIVPRAFRSPM